jgi:mannitol-1-/sugar-/sorbitol-6-phosphatase
VTTLANRGLRARGVLLDLDGVLADSQSAIESAWRDWAALHGFAARDVLSRVAGTRSEDVIREIAPDLDPVAETAWLEAREGEQVISPCAGAISLVSALRDTPWAVVTSGQWVTATTRLRRIGIPIPDVLVTASDIQRGKPDPEGYLTAARALGVPPDECVVIEDASAGVAAARAARAAVIGIRGPNLAGAPVDLLVGSLVELRVEARGPDITLTRADGVAAVEPNPRAGPAGKDATGEGGEGAWRNP